MTRCRNLPVVAAALVLTGSSLVYGGELAATGKRGDVEVSKETRIGETTLAPGFYRMQHATLDGRHVLVVKKRYTEFRGGQTVAFGAGKEVARVPCDVVAQDAKVRDTAIHVRIAPDGSRSIAQVQIRGERAGHLVASEPKA